MSGVYRQLVRPWLFRRDAEAVHDLTLRRLEFVADHRWMRAWFARFFGAPMLPVETLGLRFPNPVGLAAGMDKAGRAVPVWAAMGFGHCELGAVTWHAQPGNPPPRVFRAVSAEAIVNRMGFNNAGAEAFAAQLKGWRESGAWPAHPVGVNLGKSKITPLAQAAEDYAATFRLLWPLADFFVVNVSSPNTPNLRQLQDKAALDEILAGLTAINQEHAARCNSRPKPLLVKIAPDLSFDALDEILALVEPRQVAGLIATNTTIARPPTNDPRLQRVYAETGGLSGRPLRARSTEVIRHLYRQARGQVPIIGVGGIFTGADAWEKITAGATLVQVYTGLVFEGPAVARHIVRDLRQRLAAAGLRELREAVGLAAQQ